MNPHASHLIHTCLWFSEAEPSVSSKQLCVSVITTLKLQNPMSFSIKLGWKIMNSIHKNAIVSFL